MATMNPPEPTCDIVERTWKRLNLSKGARQAALSSFKMVFLFSALFLDMSYSLFSDFFAITHPVLWFVELSICVLLVLHIMSNGLLLFKYMWVYFFGSAVNITEEQRLLMAIPLNDKGFQTPPKSSSQFQHSTPLTFTNPHNYSASSNHSDHSPLQRSLLHTPPSPATPSTLYGPNNYSFHHAWGDHNRSTSSRQSPYHSFVSLKGSFNASYSSLDRSLNASGMSQSSTKNDFNATGLRSRRSTSLPLSPRGSAKKRINSVDSLNKYIMEEEEKTHNNIQASPDNLSSNNMSFWSFGSSPLDFTHILKRFAYQLAPRSSTTPAPNSSSEVGSSHGFEEVWGKLGVAEDDLYLWTEKLRKWLSFTIITRLKKEINMVNTCLERIGCEDSQIGEVGISTLKQVALTRGNTVRGLNSVIPYLDLMANQEYLVHRIKGLSTGSMSAFSWNQGGNYGKPWGEHLATDAAVVMHLFCSYLDARLPAHPKYPDGKPFTSVHFLKTPDKPNLEQKDNLIIYQSAINPPHFQVVFGTEVYNLSKGRNNMFQAILLFLYLIKQKEAGMLGRVNLGKSGLNILWIFN